MIVLTCENANVLLAFHDSFELCGTEVWPEIERAMCEDFGIADPASALDAVLGLLCQENDEAKRDVFCRRNEHET